MIRKKVLLIIFCGTFMLLICLTTAFAFLCVGYRDEIEELRSEVQCLENENETLQNRLLKSGYSEQNGDAFSEESESADRTEKQGVIQVSDIEAGTIIEKGRISGWEERYFTSSDIQIGDHVYQRILGKSFQENGNVQISDLKYLKLLHYNFDHQIQVGEMIVNASLSEDILQIFKELFYAEYEIQSIYLIDNYWTGDGESTDTASIEANNTSCFNYREVTGGDNLSKHAYGCAIDVNPQQNPYVWYGSNGLEWTHENASPYIDRNCGDPRVIVAGDICCSTFEKYGFSWGGNWSNPIDYQHFEKWIY